MVKNQFPELVVAALIFNQKGKVILLKSHKWRNKYVIPGGHVELGERFEDALKREIKEETGLNIFDIKFVCFQESIFDSAFWKKGHAIVFNFACKTNSTAVKLDSESEEFVWVSLEEALKLPIEPYSRETIKEYMKKKIKNIS